MPSVLQPVHLLTAAAAGCAQTAMPGLLHHVTAAAPAVAAAVYQVAAGAPAAAA